MEQLAPRFERERPRIRAIAYRILGSLSDAEDAVQDTWLRLAGAGDQEIENLPAWLTTVVTRVCLNLLQRRRREVPLRETGDGPEVQIAALDPEHEAVLADSVGMALQVVLDTLSPPERVAFVLHDVFAVPFDEIARVLDRSTVAVRQLASRARRRVAEHPAPDPDLTRQWQATAAYYEAVRQGEFRRLLELLDPDVVLRVEGEPPPGAPVLVRGAEAVAQRASVGARTGRPVRLALVDGLPGAVAFEADRPFAVFRLRFDGLRIAEITMITAPDRLHRL